MTWGVKLAMLGGLLMLAMGAWPQGLKGETVMTSKKMTLEQRVGA